MLVGTTLVVVCRSLCCGCTRDNIQLVCADDVGPGSRARSLAGNNCRDWDNDFRIPSVAGSCD